MSETTDDDNSISIHRRAIAKLDAALAAYEAKGGEDEAGMLESLGKFREKWQAKLDAGKPLATMDNFETLSFVIASGLCTGEIHLGKDVELLTKATGTTPQQMYHAVAYISTVYEKNGQSEFVLELSAILISFFTRMLSDSGEKDFGLAEYIRGSLRAYSQQNENILAIRGPEKMFAECVDNILNGTMIGLKGGATRMLACTEVDMMMRPDEGISHHASRYLVDLVIRGFLPAPVDWRESLKMFGGSKEHALKCVRWLREEFKLMAETDPEESTRLRTLDLIERAILSSHDSDDD